MRRTTHLELVSSLTDAVAGGDVSSCVKMSHGKQARTKGACHLERQLVITRKRVQPAVTVINHPLVDTGPFARTSSVGGAARITTNHPPVDDGAA